MLYKQASLLVSYLFHPMLMTTYLVVLTAFYTPASIGLDTLMPSGKWLITGIFAVMTFILPMISMTILRLFSNISSFHLEDRKERILPMVFTTIYYIFAVYFLVVQNPVAAPLGSVIIGVTITLLVITLITLFWKISAHAAATWGCAGMILALNQFIPDPNLKELLVGFILCAGVVSSARLYLGAHNLSQVAAGALVGFTICFSTIKFTLGF